MKTLALKITLALLLIAPIFLVAQTNSIDKLYEKYAGKDGITSINLSAEMFKLAAGFAAGTDEKAAQEMKDAINQINGMKIIVLNDSLNKIMPEFKKDFSTMVVTKDFVELMSIDEKDSKVKFMTKKNKDDSYSDVLMLATSKNEVVVMSFTGNIKPETLGKLSRTMNFHGMENLEVFNKK